MSTKPISNSDRIQGAKEILPHIAPLIFDALKDLEGEIHHINQIADELRDLDDLPEEDDRFVDMLGDLGRALERHATAMRNEMRVLFEDDDEDGGETRHG